MKYLHTMVRVADLEASVAFFALLGLEETRRYDDEGGRFTLVFMAPPNQHEYPVELTYNWDGDTLGEGSRNFGHLAYAVPNIYEACQRLMDGGVTINRPLVTATWPLFGHQTIFQSNCFNKVKHLPRKSHGRRWKMWVNGRDDRTDICTPWRD